MENLFNEMKERLTKFDVGSAEFIDILEKYLIFAKMKHYLITNKYETYIPKKQILSNNYRKVISSCVAIYQSLQHSFLYFISY